MYPYDMIIRSLICFVVIATLLTLCLCKAAGEADETASRFFSQLPEAQPDQLRLMLAISQVENTKRNIVGRYGERSEFQLTMGVWEDNSKMPFWWASSDNIVHRQETLRVVKAHLAWIERHIRKYHPTRYSIYAIFVVWKGGWDRFDKLRVRPQDIDYALRALSLYSEK